MSNIVPHNTRKPTSAVRLSVGNIPKEIKKFDRWILWRYVSRLRADGRVVWTKVPYSAKHRRKIDATDHTNGVGFTDAVKALRESKGEFDGLGFLLGAGIAGIDVDDCIDEDGNLNERGERMSLAYRETYAEVSPSGRGFKILVNIGDDPKLAVIGKNTAEMEVYGGNRYFTVTGAALPGHAGVIAPMAQAFEQTAAALGANKPAPAAIADMPDSTDAKDTLGIDMKAARELLDHLPFKWCDEYGDWLRAGMAMHHEFGGSQQALDLWDEWSQRSPKYEPDGCAGKWGTFGRPGKDVITMCTVVREAQATGWRAPQTIERAIKDFSPFDDVPVTIDETGELSAPPDWWWQHSVGDMLREPAPEKNWVWRGVLMRGKVMVLAGSGGSSKSFLMLGVSLQYALNNSWGPFELVNDPGKVLLMYGEEDKSDVHDRVQTLRHAFMLEEDQIQQIAERVAVLPLRGQNIELAKEGKEGVVITEQMERLRARIKEFNIELVVMDPMSMLHSLDENDNIAITRFMNALDELAMDTNCAIVLIHHFSKGGPMKAREVNESNVRGASALVARARTVVVMHRLREDEAAEWGVPESDHSRWVMWLIAKNNYGPTGQRVWFNVDEQNGHITPSQTQLTYLNSRDIREAARQHTEDRIAQDITAREFTKQQKEAEEAIRTNARMQVVLQYILRKGKAPTITSIIDMFADNESLRCSREKARRLLETIKDEEYLDTDGVLNAKGTAWLEAQEILE